MLSFYCRATCAHTCPGASYRAPRARFVRHFSTPVQSACADGSCGARQYDEDGKLIELKYKPIYKDLFGGEFKREWLADGFAAAFEER